MWVDVEGVSGNLPPAIGGVGASYSDGELKMFRAGSGQRFFLRAVGFYRPALR